MDALRMSDRAPRRIWLCADDYGISPAVDVAIRDLAVRRRLNATSVMVLSPNFHRAEATALATIAEPAHIAIGLHVTLSAPFAPLSANFAPLRKGAFLPLPQLLLAALARRLQPQALRDEVTLQVRTFIDHFGRPPEFIDGHQHVHLFPQIRDAVLATAKALAPNAWVRQCGSAAPLMRRLGDPKGLLIDALSRSFRRRARALGLRTNPAFAGTYRFDAQADYASLFPGFLEGLPDGALVMCHPGFVDAELKRLDPLTTLRERELEYFMGKAFSKALTDRGMTLA